LVFSSFYIPDGGWTVARDLSFSLFYLLEKSNRPASGMRRENIKRDREIGKFGSQGT